MRSLEQLNNLRMVFVGMFGPIILFLSDDAINMMADRIQDRVNNLSDKKSWEIRIRTNENKDLPWIHLVKEPTNPSCSFAAISNKCSELLDKYPKILAIQISTTTGGMLEEYLFDRNSHK